MHTQSCTLSNYFVTYIEQVEDAGFKYFQENKKIEKHFTLRGPAKLPTHQGKRGHICDLSFIVL